ncbi:MAG: hypothetical protein ACEQSR_03885 [Candidatus Methylacidiphilales bacterium]
MATKTKKPKKVGVTKNPFTPIEEVILLFDNYLDTKKAIIDNYLIGDSGMVLELETADYNFKTELGSIQDEETFESILAQLKRVKHLKTPTALLSRIIEVESITVDTLLEIVAAEDEDAIRKYQSDDGSYAVIKMESLEHRMKLEEFIKKEIYPNYADENKYTI